MDEGAAIVERIALGEEVVPERPVRRRPVLDLGSTRLIVCPFFSSATKPEKARVAEVT